VRKHFKLSGLVLAWGIITGLVLIFSNPTLARRLKLLTNIPSVSLKNPNQNFVKTSRLGTVSVGGLIGYVNLFPDKADFPYVFLVPDNFIQNNTNVMALDFDIFRNLAFGRKVKIIVSADKVNSLREYLRLGIYQNLDKSSLPEQLRKQLEREGIYFLYRHPDGRHFDVDGDLNDFVEFYTWDAQGRANIDGVAFTKRLDGNFEIVENGTKNVLDGTYIKPLEVELVNVKPISKIPEFGTTILGPNSGMDPSGLTTNYIIWSGKRAVLVDVGEYTLDMLKKLNVGPERITDVFLTHIHEDHAGGFLRFLNWVVESGHSINLITAKTVLDGLETRLSFLLGREIKLSEYMNIIDVEQNPSIELDSNTVLETGFSFHPVPTIWGKVHRKINDAIRTISFSADHMYDLERYQGLYEGKFSTNPLIDQGIRKDLIQAGLADNDGIIRVLPQWRKEYFEKYPFYKNPENGSGLVDLLIFDLGGFGIHTEPTAFGTLPPEISEIRRRTIAVHTNVQQRQLSQDLGIMVGIIGLTIEVTPEGNLVKISP